MRVCSREVLVLFAPHHWVADTCCQMQCTRTCQYECPVCCRVICQVHTPSSGTSLELVTIHGIEVAPHRAHVYARRVDLSIGYLPIRLEREFGRAIAVAIGLFDKGILTKCVRRTAFGAVEHSPSLGCRCAMVPPCLDHLARFSARSWTGTELLGQEECALD